MHSLPDAAASVPVLSQSRYQVRLHVGVRTSDPVAVAALVADAHVVVVADALREGEGDTNLLTEGRDVLLLAGDFRMRTAVARAVLDEQTRRGDRAMVAIVTPARADGQFAVEDFLLAGAIVDALATLGIDYSSPEAAAACAAFTGLRGAVGHLVSASAAGQEWIGRGLAADVTAVTAIDSSDRIDSIRTADRA
ncbi:2-phosphosulfolactate phosphatase [Herbiconiux ginsengi]|uniref:Probable 2-phosphosulfolactate phosphatase n=1 Tax=Herbiconiux ginsengi TaxID=381665 RepID=A0A1H3K2K9_9MICO|nr:2-phosphosulfolactate phosphatase [Herbiconiux ginsengi]SDY46432.1 2-phosphosulpholactate phosphatase [Herbiconiux ginsengi]